MKVFQVSEVQRPQGEPGAVSRWLVWYWETRFLKVLQRQTWAGDSAREAKGVRFPQPVTSLLTSTVAEVLAGP